jgi:hypothetical protein
MHATNQTQLRALLENNVLVEWVPVDQIDRTPYARPISMVALKRMVAAAKTQTLKQTQDNMGVVTLTLQPTGRYNCVDGNHRTALARELGLETILARIVIDITPEQEAKLFEMIHTVHLPTAQDRFRARLYRYEPTAMHIQEILRHYNLEIAAGKRTAPGKLVAVAALDQVYTQMGPTTLRRIIEILSSAWGTDDTRPYVGVMLLGMATFLLRYGSTLDQARLIDKLQATTAQRIMAEASSPSATVRESPMARIGRVILRVYNSGLRSNSPHLLPDWIDRPGTMFKSARQKAREDVEQIIAAGPQE